MHIRPDRRARLPRGVTSLMLAVALFAVAFPLAARGRGLTSPLGPARQAAARVAATPRRAARTLASASAIVTGAAAVSKPAQAEVVSSPATATRPAVVAPRPAPAGPSIDAYRGLGTWVDIYDDRAWNDPAGAVRDMAKHGVRTLYLETANSRAPSALKDPAALATFIRTAHASKMRVVAWYLADLKSTASDQGRIASAIRFRTPDGQTFDSFALDIESDAVKDVAARNRALEELSGKLRTLAGPSYPLGAIIPSPVGMSRDFSNWSPFPYGMLARKYDVFVPMAYYTWHGKGNAAAYADALANVRILRAQPGCAKTPIHLIGGLAEESSPSEVKAFVQAGRQTGCVGASLYGWAGTNGGAWEQLKAVTP